MREQFFVQILLIFNNSETKQLQYGVFRLIKCILWKYKVYLISFTLQTISNNMKGIHPSEYF